MWRWRQKREWCIYNHRMPRIAGEARNKAWDGFSLRISRKSAPANTWFGTSGLLNGERINFCCFKPFVLWLFVMAAPGSWGQWAFIIVLRSPGRRPVLHSHQKVLPCMGSVCRWHWSGCTSCVKPASLPLISAWLLHRISIFNIIPALRYYGEAIFSCKYMMQASCLSIIMFDIIFYLEFLMNRWMLDGACIPSGSRIKMLGDKITH